MKDKEEIISKFEIECSCGYGELVFSQWKDDGIAFISYNIPAFFAGQHGRWDRIRNGFKVFWNLVFLDKEYSLYEIVIEDNEKLNSLKKFVSEFKEIEENNGYME